MWLSVTIIQGSVGSRTGRYDTHASLFVLYAFILWHMAYSESKCFLLVRSREYCICWHWMIGSIVGHQFRLVLCHPEGDGELLRYVEAWYHVNSRRSVYWHRVCTHIHTCMCMCMCVRGKKCMIVCKTCVRIQGPVKTPYKKHLTYEYFERILPWTRHFRLKTGVVSKNGRDFSKFSRIL